MAPRVLGSRCCEAADLQGEFEREDDRRLRVNDAVTHRGENDPLLAVVAWRLLWRSARLSRLGIDISRPNVGSILDAASAFGHEVENAYDWRLVSWVKQRLIYAGFTVKFLFHELLLCE